MIDLCKVAKYQSISDRIKRLASPTHGSPSSQLPPSTLLPSSCYQPRQFTSPGHQAERKLQPSDSYKMFTYEKGTPSRVNTQETERTKNESTHTFIDDMRSKRDDNSNKMMKKDLRRFTTENENSFMDSFEKEMIQSRWKRQEKEQEEKLSKNQLSKVKSEGTLKVDQILESYNSYKQNKEQFLSQFRQQSNKDHQHQRIVSQNLKQYFLEENQNKENGRQTHRENIIDSLWNQVPSELKILDKDEPREEAQPQFQRSRRPKILELQELNELRERDTYQVVQPQRRTHKYSQSKLICRNRPVQREINKEPLAALNIVLSPRGTRVPGKICKNSDKSAVLQSRRYQ